MERRIALLLATVLVLAAVPGTVAAQEVRTDDTIIIGANETVDGLTAASGTVIVRGTVAGDLTAFTGNVLVPGAVEGDVEAFSGNVRINGTVSGDVNAFGGNLLLGRGGEIGGDLRAAAGTVVIDGAIRGDATIGAGSIVLGSSAVLGGDLRYDADLDVAPGARVAGTIERSDDLGVFGVSDLGGWAFGAYGFLVNLLFGAVLVFVFPSFSLNVADRAGSDPVRSAGVGLLLLVAIPVLLVALAITIVGIPLSLIGAVLFGLLLWIAAIYGAFALGTWLLSTVGTANKWLALAVGLLAVAVLRWLPIVGGLVQFVVLLIGLGALAAALRSWYRGRRVASEPAEPAMPGEADESGSV